VNHELELKALLPNNFLYQSNLTNFLQSYNNSVNLQKKIARVILKFHRPTILEEKTFHFHKNAYF